GLSGRCRGRRPRGGRGLGDGQLRRRAHGRADAGVGRLRGHRPDPPPRGGDGAAPKFSQTLANFSGSASASLVSSCTMRLVTPLRIAVKTALSWIISRETLSGRSALSTTT